MAAAGLPAAQLTLVPGTGRPALATVAGIATSEPQPKWLDPTWLDPARLSIAQVRDLAQARNLGGARNLAQVRTLAQARARAQALARAGAASRSASRVIVRPPLVAQRFVRAAAAKRSAAVPMGKPRARMAATGPGRRAGGVRALGPRPLRANAVPVRAAERPGDATGSGLSALLAYAWAQVGKSYVLGAEGPDAFDCSGFTMQAYKRIGIYLPHSSGAQAAMAHWVSLADARAGDLVVGPGHVGIYLGNGRMIDAGNPRVGVVYREMFDGLHVERF